MKTFDSARHLDDGEFPYDISTGLPTRALRRYEAVRENTGWALEHTGQYLEHTERDFEHADQACRISLGLAARRLVIAWLSTGQLQAPVP